MALAVLTRLHLLRKAAVPLLSSSSIWSSSACRQLSASKAGLRWMCIASREPVFLVSGSIRLSRDSSVTGRPTTLLHPPSSDKDGVFKNSISSCISSQQVLRLLRSFPELSGAAAASVLHRLADLEEDGVGGLRDPSVLLSDTALAELCSKLEKESAELDDEVVIHALLGCTRLYLDPSSCLVVRLVSESQVRLNRGSLNITALCGLARALFALEGPDCVMLAEVMRQLRSKDAYLWNINELIDVYSMLAAGVAEGGRHQDLLNEMNSQSLSLAPWMDPATVSKTLGALVTLNQAQVVPLVIALCKYAVKHVPHFTDAELSVLLSALMHYGYYNDFLVKALEEHMLKTAFSTHPETISKLMQYFGQLRIFSPQVFDAVAESFVYRADEYSAEQVSQLVAALGVVGYVPKESGRLFRKLESVIDARFSQFQPKSLLELLHACTLLQRYPLNFVSKVLSPYFLQQLHGESSVIDCVALAQLIQLYMTVKLECPSYDLQSPWFLRKLHMESFLFAGNSIETEMDHNLCRDVMVGLQSLLGNRNYFTSGVLTQFGYTLDVEIKLDKEGCVLAASEDDVCKRIALCIDGPRRYASNASRLLGKEAIKQRHLRILGYEVVQIPYFEFNNLKNKKERVKYLHQKIFPKSYRFSW
ncbi:FAST kinase domain-containing protein 3, mitochondrial [Astyanax mexicanus]|uniref:FAST kinase domain-containing protein 3, mitochondrial n=1 Tax=Astyanax mexicanus TaxID=7994 RepID=UPI0020CAEADF|nr:FAST kinase domain-containing protein 3, mitochondrial [Astyanax mexicanus]